MITQDKWIEPLMNWTLWVPPAAMSIFLIVVAQYNFLAFHTIAELITIVISFVIFALAWSTHGFSKNNFLLFLACGYFWIGIIDLMHIFAYKGIDVFMEGSGNLSVLFWLSARYLQALLLLAAPFAATRKQNGYLLVTVWGIVTVGSTTLILSGNFPSGFVEGSGLTNFKIYSEYLIDLILALALIALFRYGRNISTEEKALIAVSIAIMMCAELAFTFYVDVYGLSNLVGHVFKLFSFWLLFQAIVISNLKKPFFKLDELRDYNRTLFETSSTGLALCRMDGTLIDVNPAYAKILGRTVNETLGLDYWKVTPEKYAPQEQYQLDYLNRTGEYGPYVKEYIDKDGRLIPVQLIGKIIEREGERLIWSSVEDITERKRSEEALRESEARLSDSEGRLKKAQEIAKIGSWTWHLGDDGMINVSDEYLRIIGFPRDQPPKNQAEFNHHIHPDDIERTLKILDEAINKPSDYKAEYRFVRPDGEVRYIVELGELMYDDGGLPTGHAGTIQDITQRKETEKQLQQAQKMEAIGHLTGGIAHDFNNILTAIIGNLELMEELIDGDPETRECMNVALKACFQAADLTQRLLAFSRKQTLQSEATDVNGLVPGMTELMRRTLGENIEIETVLSGGPWQAMVDRSQLENALLNLAINARDAMPEGGKLTIETANIQLDQEYADRHEDVTPGKYIMVAMSDNGTGMPPKVIESVFEPFFTTKEVGKGSGLGLSMVYGFVKQSGGHIKIYSEIGQGTTVKLYLPTATSTGRTTQPAEVPRTQPKGDETILVVEDDPDVRAYVVTALGILGYHVMEAEDGPSALAMLDEMPPIDLLLTDVVLPRGMNGRQIADEVQKRQPRVKVLFTSGYTENAIVHHGRLDKNAKLLTKPYTRETLARKVRAVIDAPVG